MIDTPDPSSPDSTPAEHTRPAWARYLFAPRVQCGDANSIPRNRFELIDFVVLALYAVILAFAIHYHLASDDEAQGWLMARDTPLSTFLLRRLHYEGAPALWPLILWIVIRLHVPFGGANWIGGAFAFAGIVVLLRFSPFPRIFRWLLPFTFFLQFQYAAIARPYTLFPLLLFALCTLFPLRGRRPILFATAVGLMTNLSFHAAVIAGLFGLLYWRELSRTRQVDPRSHPTIHQRAAAFGVFGILALLAAFTAFPPADSAFPPKDAAAQVKAEAQPPSIWKRMVSRVLPPERLPAGAPPLDPPLFGSSNETSAQQPSGPLLFLAKTILISADTALYPVAKSNLLGVLFICAFFLWLQSRHRTELFLPFALSILISSQVFVYDHHTGQFLLTILAAAWIALELPSKWPSAGSPHPHRALLTAQSANRFFSSVALVVILLQVVWSLHAVVSQARHPYDPGLETAHFLEQNFAGKRVAGFSYETVTTQAYAGHNLFFNQPASYWLWSSSIFIDRRRTEVLRQHPDAIVLADGTPGPEFFFSQVAAPRTGAHDHSPLLGFFLENGFHETHRFCGYPFTRMSYSATICEVVLETHRASAR